MGDPNSVLGPKSVQQTFRERLLCARSGGAETAAESHSINFLGSLCSWAVWLLSSPGFVWLSEEVWWPHLKPVVLCQGTPRRAVLPF